MRRSCNRKEVPCAISASRFHLTETDTTRAFTTLSASVRLKLMKKQIWQRALTGCRVTGSTRPVVRTWNLSNTMCRRRW